MSAFLHSPHQLLPVHVPRVDRVFGEIHGGNFGTVLGQVNAVTAFTATGMQNVTKSQASALQFFCSPNDGTRRRLAHGGRDTAAGVFGHPLACEIVTGRH